jgi:hypothetical protein
MEVFTVDCEINMYPIIARCGQQADCLGVKHMMHLDKTVVLFWTSPIFF